MKKVTRKVHTPISFRAQRQLRFTPTSAISTPANPKQNESQDNAAADFSTPAGQQIAAQNINTSHAKDQNSDDQLQAALSLQALNQQNLRCFVRQSSVRQVRLYIARMKS